MISIAIVPSIATLLLDTYRGRNFRYRPALVSSRQVRQRIERGLSQTGLCALQTQESRAVARKPRDAAAVLVGFKFVNNIYYKFNSSHASKARLQTQRLRAPNTGAKQNLTQNDHSRSFKVTCFGAKGKAITD